MALKLATPPTMGVPWIDQLLPFQASTSAAPPLASWYVPTDRHNVTVGQDTPINTGSMAPFGTGTVCTLHAVPSHRSANGMLVSGVAPKLPTAVHASPEEHATPKRVARAELGEPSVREAVCIVEPACEHPAAQTAIPTRARERYLFSCMRASFADTRLHRGVATQLEHPVDRDVNGPIAPAAIEMGQRGPRVVHEARSRDQPQHVESCFLLGDFDREQ
jgi:hypothetical protein